MKRRFGYFFVAALAMASPAHAAWDSFEIIQWQKRDPAQLETLRRLGVTAVTVIANRDGTGTPLELQTAAPHSAGLRWYIENIATDLYASYHRYTPGKDVNWRFIAAQDQYRANSSDNTALVREPSLLDPAWREKIRARLTQTVQQEKPFRPLYYSLGDENGIADLTAYWDFDLSPYSVAGFRTWLRGQYGSLASLNAEWGTSYQDWNAVQPETTKQTMLRTDDNFAAWNDFKAWMDTSFVDALRSGTDAIHRADPAAISGMEGVQVPGWGGYDYTKLAHAVDLMEIGDDGINLAIIRSINPRIIPLTTSFAASPADLRGIWSNVLDGSRGLILWDEDDSITRPDASPGPRAESYAPLFAALRGKIGRWMIDARPIHDSVAVLYSPVSFRVRWILDHRPDGDAWMHRSSEMELQDNAWRVALRDYVTALGRMGLHPRFITPEQLASGPPTETALILPHAIALSAAEANAINAFAARGGQVIADTPPGQFDEHGRKLPAPRVATPIVAPADLAKVLKVTPMFRVEAPDNDVESHVYIAHGQRLLALQRGAAKQTPETVTVELNGSHARDLATGRDYGKPARLMLTLDPITPAFLEIDR
jgi:Beta-galactosidase